MICASCGADFEPFTPHICTTVKPVTERLPKDSGGWPAPADDPGIDWMKNRANAKKKRHPYHHVNKYNLGPGQNSDIY